MKMMRLGENPKRKKRNKINSRLITLRYPIHRMKAESFPVSDGTENKSGLP